MRPFGPHHLAALAYAVAYLHGIELELDDLHLEMDEARDSVERGLKPRELPVRRATLAGLEHAQIERIQGKARVPKTFVV